MQEAKGQDDLYPVVQEETVKVIASFWQMFLIFSEDKDSDVRGQTAHVAVSSSKQPLACEPSSLW